MSSQAILALPPSRWTQGTDPATISARSSSVASGGPRTMSAGSGTPPQLRWDQQRLGGQVDRDVPPLVAECDSAGGHERAAQKSMESVNSMPEVALLRAEILRRRPPPRPLASPGQSACIAASLSTAPVKTCVGSCASSTCTTAFSAATLTTSLLLGSPARATKYAM